MALVKTASSVLTETSIEWIAMIFSQLLVDGTFGDIQNFFIKPNMRKIFSMTFGRDIHDAQRINLNNFLTFHLAPAAGQNFTVSTKISQHLPE